MNRMGTVLSPWQREMIPKEVYSSSTAEGLIGFGLAQ